MTKLTQITSDEDGATSSRRIHLREISGDGDAPLETVGQDLRAARIRRGDDLAAVSRALKIRKDHLDALEGDRIDDLPGKTYAIGFVRSYARYLGLDAAEMAERFKTEISGRNDEQQHVIAAIHEDEPKKLPYGWRIVAGFVVLALCYGVYHIFFGAHDSIQAVPPAPTLPKVAQADPAPKPANPTATVAIPTPPADSAKPAAPSGDNANPVAMATPAAGAAGAPSPQAAVPAVSPGQVFGAANKNSRVVLRARGATHIEVRGRDGTVYINRTLASGDSYRLPDIVGLALTTTNAGAVEVDLDGMAMGNAGGELQPVGGVSLDPQDIMDRYSNRHT